MDTRNATTNRLGYSIQALAAACGVSAGLVRLEIARGRLKVARIGRRVVIPVEAVSEWLAAGTKDVNRSKRGQSNAAA